MDSMVRSPQLLGAMMHMLSLEIISILNTDNFLLHNDEVSQSNKWKWKTAFLEIKSTLKSNRNKNFGQVYEGLK
jgi:hypothetical protein